MTQDTATKLKEAIDRLYPEVARNNLNLGVERDEETGSWLVTVTGKEKSLSTHLGTEDAEACLEGRECVHLSQEVARFLDYFCSRSGSCESVPGNPAC